MAVPGYTIAQLPVEEISMGHSRADRAAIDKAVQSGRRAPGMAKNPTRTPALDRISTRMQTPAAKPSMAKTAVKGGAYLAAGQAIADSAAKDSTARYAQRFGVSEPSGDGSVGDIAKFAALRAGGFASDLGNNLTLGAAGNLYADKPDGALQFSQANAAAPAAPAIAQPAATPAAAPQAGTQAPAAQAAPAPGLGMPGAPSIPTIGKINASRQPNGVMSFSGSGPVQGYEGPAAGQLKGGGSSGAVTPADHQAALQRAATDKASVSSLAASHAMSGTAEGLDRAYRLAAGDPEATAAVEKARSSQALRIAALNGNSGAASILNQQGANETNLSATKLKIAADMTPKPETAYDQERTRGAKADNDRAAVSDSLIAQYMNAPDEKTRATALERLNALGGKNSSDKYITVDVDTGQKDAVGNPIYAKAPFNTRTGQIASTSAAAPAAANSEYAEGDYLRGSDGKAYKVVNGQPVLVQ